MRKLHELEALLESSDTLSPITLGTHRKRPNLFLNFLSFRTYSLMVFHNLIASDHRLNMELGLQSLFGLHVHSSTHWLGPRNPPYPPAFGLI